MPRHLHRALSAAFFFVLLAQRASAQLVSSASSSSAVSSSTSTAALSSGHSVTEPSLSLPVWALAVVTVGGLLVFLATLKLASCLYWMSEKQRAERDADGLEEGRSGGVAPMAAVAPTSHVHTSPTAASTAAVRIADHARKATRTHISITQQGGAMGEGDATRELSQWDSRASDDFPSQAAHASEGQAGMDDSVLDSGGLVVVVSSERE